MARIRSIKPDVRRSRTVTSWPRDVRLAFVYLWCYLDDEGRGEDDLALIKAELFPRDRDVTERKLDNWLWIMTEKADAPLCRYRVDGVDFLHATHWTEHQRVSHPQPSTIPPCPPHELHVSGLIRTKDRGPLSVLPNESGTNPERLPIQSGGHPE